MRNNAITIFVDSVVWDCIGTTRAKVSPTPFLDSLKKESIVANKLYSHGPYTDAATRSLFTGRNCLDDFGYYFKLNTSPITHYDIFHKAGYEVYDFHYPYYIKGDKIMESIDHTVYTAGFSFASEWGGIFSLYYDINKERKLTAEEYNLLAKRFEYMFQSWKRYLDDAVYRPETMVMQTESIKDYDCIKALDILKQQISLFNENNVKYIDDFLNEGKSHILATLDPTSIDSYISSEFINDYIEKKYKKFINKVRLYNFKVNVFKNLPSLKRLLFALKRYLKNKDADEFTFVVNYFLSLTSMKLMKKRWKFFGWQGGHTARTNYDVAIDILKQRNSEQPFYMFFHVFEPHNNIAFFSYDQPNKEVIDEEFKVLEKYVDELGTNFKGNLIYFLSLRYTDLMIERFCKKLKQLNLWDTTSILFISDHGSSYTYYPLHGRRVNNFDDECYHIPMLIRHPGFKGKEINTYQYSKDVYPTFCDILGIEQSPFFKGRSMLKEKEPRNCVVTEYMGPGCPDLTSRRIWFSARDSKYIVAYKVGIYEDFKNGELAQVYNLSKDPNAMYNINDTIDLSAIQYLMDQIEHRFDEIKKDTTIFLEKLNTYK